MSKPQASYHVEETAATQLGIDTVTPRVLERMIGVIADQNLVLTVMGQSGIGKTAIPKQIAERRLVPYAQIHMPTAAPESFQLPTLPKDGSPFFDQKNGEPSLGRVGNWKLSGAAVGMWICAYGTRRRSAICFGMAVLPI